MHPIDDSNDYWWLGGGSGPKSPLREPGGLSGGLRGAGTPLSPGKPDTQ